ncbi:SMP-30/gluconolactonase/LRE family protein [Streptomyces triticagri]|uniref:SMP-30/gluconolactonase/LRE family protein n=1 Tax=Streptomyces triticagri TaxID=2293568 RepID=A0A372LWK3_9ACTN|nr:SMP-30/gluconolactonase/LRE family protein [Streptomyces triticagri]RFU82643.1 SMP-30/gluconolactonase/LRE family protein [Streptomyces triticagri]
MTAAGTDDVRTCATDRLELGEGPRWTAGRLVLTDILSGRLLTVRDGPAGAAAPLAELARLQVPLGAVAPVEGTHGRWIAAAGTGVCLLDPGRDPRWLPTPHEDAPASVRMNDGAADPAGRFWAGLMRYDAAPGGGALLRVDPDGSVHRVLEGLTVPNGPVFDAEGRTMYLADSARGLILRHRIDPRTGDPGPSDVFATVDAGSPDGMAVDRDGAVWSAVWGGGVLHRRLPDGTLDRIVRVPVAQPAGLCLGGPDGRTLYVTSARIGLTAPGPLDGALLALRVDVPGPPAHPYRGGEP